MSCFFIVDGRDAWNPSNLVGDIFVRQGETLAHLLGVNSGIGGMEEDECEINGSVFAEFISVVVRKFRGSNNEPLKVMIAGFSQIGIVLLLRSGVNVDAAVREAENFWRVELQSLSARMVQS